MNEEFRYKIFQNNLFFFLTKQNWLTYSFDVLQVRNAGNKETIRRGVLMNMVKITAKTLPLYVGKPGEKTPPLCGAVPADSRYIAKPGDIVAALVKGLEDGDGWILAEIVTFNPTQNKYEVDDIDETKNRHVLSKRRIVPLPLMRANPETNPDALFAKGTMGKLFDLFLSDLNIHSTIYSSLI